jgi:protoporphyrinogen oxidase
MYESMAKEIQQKGGQVLFEHNVTKVHLENDHVKAVETVHGRGQKQLYEGTDFFSSMPVNELALAIDPPAPPQVIKAAKKLEYRSLITVNLMMDRKESFPDTWIYIHSPEVKVGRVQCFKNWSPFMVPDENKSSLGLEYFCTENDELWNCPDEKLIELAKKEIAKLKLADPDTICDAFVIRMPKTYPVYSMGYSEHLEVIKNYLSGIKNLQCIGRNGMFKYNNMDHSILSAMLAVDNIYGAHNDLWSVNTEEEYHEEKQANQES